MSLFELNSPFYSRLVIGTVTSSASTHFHKLPLPLLRPAPRQPKFAKEYDK